MDRSVDECTALRLKKSSLTLDLTSNASRCSRKAAALQGPCLLPSPPPVTLPLPSPIAAGLSGPMVVGDVVVDALKLSTPDCPGGLLKLTAAEMERVLLLHQSSAPQIASPSVPLVFLKPTSDEQEAYARGFMDALIEIRRKQLTSLGGLVRLEGAGAGPAVTPSLLALTPVSPYAPLAADAIAGGGLFPHLVPVNLTSLSSHGGCSVSVAPGQRNGSPEMQRKDPSMMPAKEATGAGSRSNSQAEQVALSNTPPQSPIDMSDQERIKLERKREKNRRAAQKCRTRKLERIARLEHRTRELRQQNTRLAQEADDVQEQLLRLKGQIAEHFRNGCFGDKGSDA